MICCVRFNCGTSKTSLEPGTWLLVPVICGYAAYAHTVDETGSIDVAFDRIENPRPKKPRHCAGVF